MIEKINKQLEDIAAELELREHELREAAVEYAGGDVAADARLKRIRKDREELQERRENLLLAREEQQRRLVAQQAADAEKAAEQHKKLVTKLHGEYQSTAQAVDDAIDTVAAAFDNLVEVQKRLGTEVRFSGSWDGIAKPSRALKGVISKRLGAQCGFTEPRGSREDRYARLVTHVPSLPFLLGELDDNVVDLPASSTPDEAA